MNTYYGGGLDCSTWNLTVVDCTFEACQNASGRGGGISQRGADGITQIKVSNCEFNNCAAAIGGGLYSEAGTILKRSSFTNCQARDYGGAIYSARTFTLDGEEQIIPFENCHANYGGAIFRDVAGFNLNITGAKFVDCYAATSGGSVYDNGQGTSTLNIQNVEVDGHVNLPVETKNAGAHGGFLCTYSGNLTINISNSKFENMYAGDTGGVFRGYNSVAKLTVDNCEFNDFQANNYGGAICHGHGEASTCTISTI